MIFYGADLQGLLSHADAIPRLDIAMAGRDRAVIEVDDNVDRLVRAVLDGGMKCLVPASRQQQDAGKYDLVPKNRSCSSFATLITPSAGRR